MKTLTDNIFIINRKKILYDQRYTMSRLARDLGVTPAAIGQSINGKVQSLRMHRIIAQKLGVELAEFWPEFYGPIKNAVSHDCTVNEVHESVN